jgi:hypothetical protein
MRNLESEIKPLMDQNEDLKETIETKNKMLED